MVETVLWLAITIGFIIPVVLFAWINRDDIAEIQCRIRDLFLSVRASRKPQKDGQAELRSYYSERHHAREIARTQWDVEFWQLELSATMKKTDVLFDQWKAKQLLPEPISKRVLTFSPGGYIPPTPSEINAQINRKIKENVQKQLTFTKRAI